MKKSLLLLAVLATPALAQQQSTLDSVRSKGYVQCGVNTGVAGFSAPDSKGVYKGIDVDLCRAVAAAVFGPLAEANINLDMIVQIVSEDGSLTDITFTVTIADYDRAWAVLEAARGQIGYQEIQGSTDVAKISVIGIGMRSHAGVAASAFKALASRGINIRAITTSEIKISMLIDAPFTELAVRTLHSLYGLDEG